MERNIKKSVVSGMFLTVVVGWAVTFAWLIFGTGCDGIQEQRQVTTNLGEGAIIAATERITYLEEEEIRLKDIISANADVNATRLEQEALAFATSEKELAIQFRDEINARLTQMERIVDENGTIDFNAILSAAAPWVPGGILLPLAIVGGLIKNSRAKAAVRTAEDAITGLVNALDGAKSDSPNLAKAFHESGDSLRSRMPEVTKLAVTKIRNMV